MSMEYNLGNERMREEQRKSVVALTLAYFTINERSPR